MGEAESKLAICCHLLSLPPLELHCVQLSCLPMWSHGNPLKTTLVVTNAISSFLQTGSYASFLRIIPTQLINHAEVDLVPTWCLQQYTVISLVQGGTPQVTKREPSIPTHSQTDLQSDLHERYARVIVALNLWE